MHIKIINLRYSLVGIIMPFLMIAICHHSLASAQQGVPNRSNLEIVAGNLAIYLMIARGMDNDPGCKKATSHEDPQVLTEIFHLIAQKDGSRQASPKQINEMKALMEVMVTNKLPDGMTVADSSYRLYRNMAIESTKTLPNSDYCSVLRGALGNAVQTAKNAISAMPQK